MHVKFTGDVGILAPPFASEKEHDRRDDRQASYDLRSDLTLSILETTKRGDFGRPVLFLIRN